MHRSSSTGGSACASLWPVPVASADPRCGEQSGAPQSGEDPEARTPPPWRLADDIQEYLESNREVRATLNQRATTSCGRLNDDAGRLRAGEAGLRAGDGHGGRLHPDAAAPGHRDHHPRRHGARGRPASAACSCFFCFMLVVTRRVRPHRASCLQSGGRAAST